MANVLPRSNVCAISGGFTRPAPGGRGGNITNDPGALMPQEDPDSPVKDESLNPPCTAVGPGLAVAAE